MTIQDTSRESFHSGGGNDGGGRNEIIRCNILEVLSWEGPLTANEVIYKLITQDDRPLTDKGAFRRMLALGKGEFNVLWHMGCIEPIEKRRCSISERRCAVWKFIKHDQSKPPKRPHCPECAGAGFLDWEDWIMENWIERYNKSNESTTKEQK